MHSAILFDFNGVIIDDEPEHCDALIATLAEYGHELDRDTYYREYLGFDDRECFRFSFERAGQPLDDGALAGAIERKHEHYRRAVQSSMRLVPGAREFIEGAALDGYELAIVSGALRREIELILEQAGLRPYFDEIVAAEDVSACKPDPQGYRRACEIMGFKPDRCVVVEDSRPGLDAAHAAGMRCVMITTSHDAEALAGADLVWPDFVGRDPAQLPWRHA